MISSVPKVVPLFPLCSSSHVHFHAHGFCFITAKWLIHLLDCIPDKKHSGTNYKSLEDTSKNSQGIGRVGINMKCG